MRERHFFIRGMGLLCLLCLVGIASNVYTAHYSVRQYQAVVGNLYQEYPETAKKLLYTTFDGQRTKEAQQKGLKAARDLGYTEDAYDIYYRQIFPNYGWIVFLSLAFVIAGLLCVMVWRYALFYVQKIGDINRRLEQCKKEESSFFMEKRAGGEWLSLEHHLLKITDTMKQQRAYFVKRQEQMQVFMENIAHQIKTPLACILLNLELLQDRTEQGAGAVTCGRDVNHLIADSLNQGERIRKLLLQLLNLARLEAGKIHFHKEKVELEELLSEIQSEFPEGKVEVIVGLEKAIDNGVSDCGKAAAFCNQERTDEVKFSDNVKGQWLWGDRRWLFEAFLNLVDNSVKYAAKDIPVEIEVRRMHESVKIMVRDYGQGISTEEVQRLFERYYVGGTMDDVRTGIGLNMAKYIILGHHGTIRANSVEGKGTTMEISLPCIKWKEKIAV